MIASVVLCPYRQPPAVRLCRTGASCTGEITYIVLPGDTCSDIASWYGISVADLRAANPGLNCGALKLYQELCVPAAGPGAWPEPGLAPAAGPGAGPGAAPAPEGEGGMGKAWVVGAY